MSEYIPKDITSAKKQGFSSPDSSWFKGDSIDFVCSKLMTPNAKIYDMMEKEVIYKLIEKHLTGKENLRLLIWSLIYVEEMLNAL